MARRIGWTCWALAGVIASPVVAEPAADADAPDTINQQETDASTPGLPGVDPLPEAPTREDVSVYLSQIAEMTEVLGQVPRRDDPQVPLLEAVAVEHLDALVQAHEGYPQLRYYLDPIIHREIARRGGPDLQRLSGIGLRANADDDAAWAYVNDIARATLGQRRVSSHDPQVELLEALASEHMGLLIDAVELPDLRFYAMQALRRSVGEAHKDTIIDALVDHPRLIGFVRQHGWADDARDQLVLGLTLGVDCMPRTWVQVTAGLSDPACYDALLLQLARSRCAKSYYTILRDLPGIELDAAVAEGWLRVRTAPTHPRELREAAEIAVAHGRLDALEHLVDLLPASASHDPARDAGTRQAVLEHITFVGTNDEIKDWFEANRGRLVFSQHDGVFYVAGLMH